jgi:hypothetical protein
VERRKIIDTAAQAADIIPYRINQRKQIMVNRIFGLLAYLLFSFLIYQFLQVFGSVKTADIGAGHIILCAALIVGKFAGFFLMTKRQY